eukprot:XP_011407333.1 PREDICTED: uncharacterized protein LOC100635367 [Amphimedon queenslandica]
MRAQNEGDLERRTDAIAAIEKEIEASIARRQRRLLSIEGLHRRLEIDEELPIAAHARTIADAIERHPLILVAGATGSGKSTQLPKICLRLGRGVRGMIGHTQPRRLAARSIAGRIACELGSQVGGLVGYQVRFQQRIAQASLVKSMSDGILLAETRSDPDLLAYDTLIIDEAHERSLNIDFLLGYLQRLLPRRPDLRVVIASATLEAEKLARFFGSAPVIEVPGRSWPIEIRYRPGEPDFDIGDKVAGTLEELRHREGDVLIFLSGEREIREIASKVEGLAWPDTEVFPLHSRLSDAKQQALFDPPSSPARRRRRIVLATNIAETSLTVPGIRFVIDAGTARISRYAHRTGVQRLPVEAISRAAADQRAGRCGRTAPGICIRLYDEEDFLARPAHPEPEIKRPSDIRDPLAFEALTSAGRPALGAALEGLLTQALSILQSAHDLRERIENPPLPLPGDSALDIRRQLAGLVHQEFLATTPQDAFAWLPRYLEGLRVRLEKLRQGGANDLRRLAAISPLQQRMEAKALDRRERRRHDAELIRYRWMLEEYRLSLFAQETGLAAGGISEKRLARQWALVEDGG